MAFWKDVKKGMGSSDNRCPAVIYRTTYHYPIESIH